jgi:hypothetical protein
MEELVWYLAFAKSSPFVRMHFAFFIWVVHRLPVLLCLLPLSSVILFGKCLLQCFVDRERVVVVGLWTEQEKVTWIVIHLLDQLLYVCIVRDHVHLA